jgi:hypothetical protein
MQQQETDPRAAWYAWRTAATKRGDPLSDDPLANYEFGVKIGQRLALERTASWSGLVPLLQDVLDYLVETAIEHEATKPADDWRALRKV